MPNELFGETSEATPTTVGIRGLSFKPGSHPSAMSLGVSRRSSFMIHSALASRFTIRSARLELRRIGRIADFFFDDHELLAPSQLCLFLHEPREPGPSHDTNPIDAAIGQLAQVGRRRDERHLIVDPGSILDLAAASLRGKTS